MSQHVGDGSQLSPSASVCGHDERQSVVTNSFYVYVVQEVKASKTAPIKIGVSNDVARRFTALQISNPRELELKAKFGPMAKVNAFAFERLLHTRLRRFHLRGEWFSGKALKEIFRPA